MPRSSSHFRTLLVLLAGASPLAAKDVPATSPAALQKVLDCRSLADGAARLACFDASVAQLEAARSSGDIALVDREQVRETKRKLFGFTLPGLDLFGHKDDKDRPQKDEVEEIVAKVRTAGQDAEGMWVITLDDGARWIQTGPLMFGRPPHAGSTATIRKAALGSYKMSIDGSPAVKAKRIG